MTLTVQNKLRVIYRINLNYRLPPRADNKTTTRGPAETTKIRLTSVKANSRLIIKKKKFLEKLKK
jgi:hypothetical protein